VETKFGWRKAGQAIMTIVSFAFFSYSFAGDYFNFPNFGEEFRFYGGVLAVFVFIATILWHFMDLQTVIDNRTPNIGVVGIPVLDDVQMDMNVKEKNEIFHITGISHMAHVGFANNPKVCTDKNSPTDIRAEITYLNVNKKQLFTIQGRWSHTDQPSEIRRGQHTTIESTNFPNNGAVRTLDLLIKYPDSSFFGYNNDSYNFPYYLHPSYEIKETKFLIHVKLKGAYIPKIWEFEVSASDNNDGTFFIKHGQQIAKSKSTMAKRIVNKIKVLAKEQKTKKRK